MSDIVFNVLTLGIGGSGLALAGVGAIRDQREERAKRKRDAQLAEDKRLKDLSDAEERGRKAGALELQRADDLKELREQIAELRRREGDAGDIPRSTG